MASSKIFNALPDVTLGSTILLAYLLDHYVPVATVIPAPARYIGWLLLIVGFGIAIHLLSGLRQKHTSTNPADSPAVLVTTGLYSRSRNPFYLSYIVTVTGAACVFGSLTAFIAPLLCFAILQFIVIPIEEQTIQKKFGQSYVDYKHAVRRWL